MGRNRHQSHHLRNRVVEAAEELGVSTDEILEILEDAKDGRVKKKTKEKINKILKD